ncbi:hypothetical protein Efla_001421 [Eimeria flavescens]
MSAEREAFRAAAGTEALLKGGAPKRSRDCASLFSLGAPLPGKAGGQAAAAAGWAPPPCKQQCGQATHGSFEGSAPPFAALTAAASRANAQLLPALRGEGSRKQQQPASSGLSRSRAVLAVKTDNEGDAAGASGPSNGLVSPLTPRGGRAAAAKTPEDGQQGKPAVATPSAGKQQQAAAAAAGACKQHEAKGAEEPWRVSLRCRLVSADLACAFSRDGGQDNHHNSRTAQSGYCQEAYRADKAHPGDYLKGFKRLSPDARDLIVCIINKVAVQLAQQSGSQTEGKQQDSLDPRLAAVVGVAVQLFDRVMAMIHKGDAAYGVNAERKQHPLRGLAGRGGTSPLLLNQLIAIACFGFADRLEAIASTDYATIVEVWRHNTAGMLRSAWPSSLCFSEALRNKLLLIERVIVAFIAPSGNIAVAPTSELVESLLNVGYLFATSHYRRAVLAAAAAADDEAQASAVRCKLAQQEEAEKALLTLDREGEVSPLGDSPSLGDLQEVNPFVEALICRGAAPDVAAAAALSLRVSGSSRVDIPRQVAQVFVRLALLDRNICLQFKPSTVAAAAAQLAMFHSGGASSFPPALQAALGAAAAAVAATGGTANFRLVRRCQFLMLHKWLNVKRILLQRGLASPAGPAAAAATAEYLPDRLIAEWVQRRLVLPHHRRVILAVQQHANSLVRCQALARQQEIEQQQKAAGKHKAAADCAAAGSSGTLPDEDKRKHQQQQQQQLYCLENSREPVARPALQLTLRVRWESNPPRCYGLSSRLRGQE